MPGAGKFLLALLVFAMAYFLLPEKARPWFALLIVLGAIVVYRRVGSLGAISEVLE